MPVQEQCFRTFGEAEEFVGLDPTPNKSRRFLRPAAEGTSVSNSGGQRSKLGYRTVGVPTATDFVTWYTGENHPGTGAGGVAIIVPDSSEVITELLPLDQFSGRYSEAAIEQGIREVDQVTTGTTSGELSRGPGGAVRFDAGLERVQVHVNYAVAGSPRLYITAARAWGITKQSRAWCPAGMNQFSEGLCRNSEEGWIRILTHLSQDSCNLPHPCVPATGAKELHETDFRWGDWDFQRHYTSLPNLATTSPVGEQWRHTFQISIPPLTGYEGTFAHIDEHGRIDLFTRVNSSLFQAHNRVGARLEYASADPLRRWRLVSDGTRIEYFSNAGKLTRIELPQATQASVDLLYCDATPFAAGACLAKGELWKVVDLRGRVLEFVYDPAEYVGTGIASTYRPARLAGVRSAGHWLAQYAQDAPGRLLAVAYPDGTTASTFTAKARWCVGFRTARASPAATRPSSASTSPASPTNRASGCRATPTTSAVA